MKLSPPPFRLCETFFQNFLISPKGPPFNLFDILQQTGFSKSPFAILYTLRVLSLRYSADFRRSRLVSIYRFL